MTRNDRSPMRSAGARLAERCDCRRSRMQAASRSVVLPTPLGPTKKLKPAANSTAADSKQRKLRNCRSRSIARALQTNEFQATRHLRGGCLPRVETAVDRRDVGRLNPDGGGDEIVIGKNSIRCIHPHPACPGQVNLRPGVKRAWTEVYLPGAGWVGMDATNGVFSNHNFIAAAVGIEPADVTPIDGSFYPRQATSAQMTSRLELVSL